MKGIEYDVYTDEVLVRGEARDFRSYLNIDATEAELERHAKPIRLPREVVREAAFGSARSVFDGVLSRLWWQGWAITCERALNSPEPGWDANGAPV